MRGETGGEMPYRDPIAALEIKLRGLREARRALDASITETLRELRQHRRAQGRSWGRVVIALIALAGCGLAALVVIVVPATCKCDDERPETTYAAVMSIVGAAEVYVARHDRCPTVEDLIRRGLIDPDRRPFTDAWDQPFLIQCGVSRAYVSSMGPDGQLGSYDDITSWQVHAP